MKTMGLDELVLVAPKYFPHFEATALAAGAVDLLERARVVDSFDQAISDCDLVFGLTARSRSVRVSALDPRAAMAHALTHARTHTCEHAGSHTSEASVGGASASKIAFVFGNERTGLSNDDLARCHFVVHILANPEYSSLNLAAAVQIICYEWQMALWGQVVTKTDTAGWAVEQPASMSELEGFFGHLDASLEAIDFYKSRPSVTIMQRLRRLFLRAQLSAREVQTLRGILSEAQRMARIARGSKH